tara:strand:+ start:375 stop:524 length:150 start_codon:yes stop_codon:yes gene_type:complete
MGPLNELFFGDDNDDFEEVLDAYWKEGWKIEKPLVRGRVHSCGIALFPR